LSGEKSAAVNKTDKTTDSVVTKALNRIACRLLVMSNMSGAAFSTNIGGVD
jgi:hypothetical protein